MCPWVTASTPSPSMHPNMLQTSPSLLHHLQNESGAGRKAPARLMVGCAGPGLPQPHIQRRGGKPPSQALKCGIGGENNGREKGRDALRAVCRHNLSPVACGGWAEFCLTLQSIPDPSDHQPQCCSPPSPLLSYSPSRSIPIPLQPARASGEMFDTDGEWQLLFFTPMEGAGGDAGAEGDISGWNLAPCAKHQHPAGRSRGDRSSCTTQGLWLLPQFPHVQTDQPCRENQSFPRAGGAGSPDPGDPQHQEPLSAARVPGAACLLQ